MPGAFKTYWQKKKSANELQHVIDVDTMLSKQIKTNQLPFSSMYKAEQIIQRRSEKSILFILYK